MRDHTNAIPWVNSMANPTKSSHFLLFALLEIERECAYLQIQTQIHAL
jgi:hypothetical protein